MTPTFSYTLDITAVKESFKMEVSKVAARTADENGNSKYDSLIAYNNDDTLVSNAIAEAKDSVIARFRDIAVAPDSGATIGFYVPDYDSDLKDEIIENIDGYIVAKATGDWFATRLPDIVQYYGAKAEDFLNRLNTLLRHRKQLER